MKNSDVINKILKYHPQFPGNYAGCDGYKFGDPNAECNGIATALVPTVDVIRRTGELGCNLLVVHEPIFYSTEDYPDWRAGGKNSVYEEKKALLDKYGITVWRDHDHMHAHNPDSIFTGVIKYLGWENYYIPSEKSPIKVPMGYLFELPETTVKELGQYLEDMLEGTDGSGKSCLVFIENVGIANDKGYIEKTHPKIRTNSTTLSWLETSVLLGTISAWEKGVIIHIYLSNQ